RQAKAGEYEFDGPLLPDEVLGKLVRGEVKLYKFTLPEGFRVDEEAAIIDQTGLCPAKDFLALARDPESPKHYGVPGPTLEGYLFPDTYALPRGTGCAAIVQTMIARFKRAWDEAQKQRAPEVKLNELQAVTLASIVEKETGQSKERAHV